MPKIFANQAELDAYAFAPPEAPKLKAAANVAVETPKQDFLASIETQLKDAMTIGANDPITSAKNLANVRGSIAAEDARFFKEAQTQAYAEYQIPRLMQALDQNIQMDRNTPSYVQRYGMADSDETAAVRRQLMTAKSAADASIQERLLGNEYYRSLKAKATSIESMIENQWKRGMERDAALEAKASEFYYSIPAEQKGLFDKAIGNTSGDPRVAMATFARLPAAEKQQLEKLMQSGEQGLALEALSGNRFAKNVLHKDETQVFGDKDQAALRLSKIEELSKDSKLSMAAFKEMKAAGFYGAGKAVEDKALAISSLLQTAGSGNKEQQQMAAQRRIEIAKDYASYKMNQEFNLDIPALRTKSTVPMPAWLEAASQRPEVGKIDKSKAIALANQAPNREEKQKRINELVEFYDSAVKTQNRSKLFNINALASEQLKAEAALSEVMSGFLGRAGLPGLESFLTNLPPLLNYEQKTGIPSNTPSQQLFEYNGEMLTKQEYDRRSGEAYYKPIRGATK